MSIYFLGANTCALGLPFDCILRPQMLDLLLRLAWSAPFHSSLSAAYRGFGELLPCLRRTLFPVLDGRIDHRSYAKRS